MDRSFENNLHIDDSQHAAGRTERVRAWDLFARRHMKEMRVLKKLGLLGAENGKWRNVAEHLLVVGGLSSLLSHRLLSAGKNINPETVETSALLHDATKRMMVEAGGKRYDRLTEETLLSRELLSEGYPPEVINASLYSARVDDVFIENDDEQKKAIAQKGIDQLLVAYSDARIRNVRIVSLDDAREMNKAKNPTDAAFYDQWHRFYANVESHLMQELQMKPEEINDESVYNHIKSITFCENG